MAGKETVVFLPWIDDLFQIFKREGFSQICTFLSISFIPILFNIIDIDENPRNHFIIWKYWITSFQFMPTNMTKDWIYCMYFLAVPYVEKYISIFLTKGAP